MAESNSSENLRSYRPYTFSMESPYFYFPAGGKVIKSTPLSGIHFHNSVEIGLCRHPSGWLSMGSCQFPLMDNSAFVIPPYSMHATFQSPPEDREIDYLYYDFSVVHKLLTNKDVSFSSLSFAKSTCSPIHTESDDPILYRLISSIFEKLQSDKASTSYQKFSLLGEMDALTEYLKALRKPTILPEYIQTVVAFINEHFNEPLDFTVAASEMYGLSPEHLRHDFLNYMHLSISEYVRHLRMENACILLLQSRTSVLNIALECGYMSLSAFQEAFHAQFGTSPTAWRKTALKTNKKSVRYLPFNPK